MPRWLPIVLWFTFGLALFAQQSTPEQGILRTAFEQVDLFGDPKANPFELDLDFQIPSNAPVHGQYILHWEAPDRWAQTAILGTFEEVDIQDGDRFDTVRNAEFSPYPVHELLGLLRVGHVLGNLHPQSHPQRASDGFAMQCLRFLPEGSIRQPFEVDDEICLDVATHDILSLQWTLDSNLSMKEQFSDYLAFGSHRYPQSLSLEQNRQTVLLAKVVSLRLKPFQTGWLTLPQGAVERHICAHIKPAVPLTQLVSPLFPRAIETVLGITVQRDGSISNLEILNRQTNPEDKADLKLIREWKWRPAVCPSGPVVADGYISFGSGERPIPPF